MRSLYNGLYTGDLQDQLANASLAKMDIYMKASPNKRKEAYAMTSKIIIENKIFIRLIIFLRVENFSKIEWR